MNKKRKARVNSSELTFNSLMWNDGLPRLDRVVCVVNRIPARVTTSVTTHKRSVRRISCISLCAKLAAKPDVSANRPVNEEAHCRLVCTRNGNGCRPVWLVNFQSRSHQHAPAPKLRYDQMVENFNVSLETEKCSPALSTARLQR